MVRIFITLLICASFARADVALLLEEQIGPFWRFNPAHSSLYFSRVCAASPSKLRRCSAGEPGTVISRYHRIDGYDWIAIPLIPYLYAVDRLNRVPASVSSEQASSLRDAYRKDHLESIAPDQSTRSKDWPQLVGEAYDRTIYGFDFQTTTREDDDLIRLLNSAPNRNQFNIVYRNCADFAMKIVDFFFPNAVHRSCVRLGIVTPNYVAQSMIRYARHDPERVLSTFEIEQVPGTIPRSAPIHGLPTITCETLPFALPTMKCP